METLPILIDYSGAVFHTSTCLNIETMWKHTSYAKTLVGSLVSLPVARTYIFGTSLRDLDQCVLLPNCPGGTEKEKQSKAGWGVRIKTFSVNACPVIDLK
jgi:hypothetical protein